MLMSWVVKGDITLDAWSRVFLEPKRHATTERRINEMGSRPNSSYSEGRCLRRNTASGERSGKELKKPSDNQKRSVSCSGWKVARLRMTRKQI